MYVCAYVCMDAIFRRWRSRCLFALKVPGSRHTPVPVEPEKSVEVTILNIFGIKITTDWIAALQHDNKKVVKVIAK